MATSRILLACLLLLLFAFYLADSDDLPEPETLIISGGTGRSLLDSTAAIDCDGACATRCKLSSRPNVCKRACGTCCTRCQCVPPGTYGNYEVCPCYASMTTHDGEHKCP